MELDDKSLDKCNGQTIISQQDYQTSRVISQQDYQTSREKRIDELAQEKIKALNRIAHAIEALAAAMAMRKDYSK